MFTKTTEYSIRVILLLGFETSPDKLMGVSAIAGKLNFPEAFIGKVMQLLVKLELVKSVKGPGGGYFLHPATYDINILNIVEQIEGLDFLNKCGLGINSCSKENPCPIHDEYNKVAESLTVALSSKTVREINNQMRLGNYKLIFT